MEISSEHKKSERMYICEQFHYCHITMQRECTELVLFDVDIMMCSDFCRLSDLDATAYHFTVLTNKSLIVFHILRVHIKNKFKYRKIIVE